MNAEHLLSVAEELFAFEENFYLQSELQSLSNALKSLSQSPQTVDLQSRYTKAFSDVEASFKASLALTRPRALAKQLGGSKAERYFTPYFISDIKKLATDNALAPSMASKQVESKVESRAEFLANLSSLIYSLRAAGIEPESTAEGEAELSVLIPRSLFHNRLDGLARELRELDKIISPFSEVATGSVEQPILRALSTTDPVIKLILDPMTLIEIGGAITWLLNTWKQTLEIKKLRDETKKMGFDTEAESLSKRIDESISKAIAQHAKTLSDKTSDQIRRPELQTYLTHSMESLLARIERGLKVEIKYVARSSELATEQDVLIATDIERIQKELLFPAPNGDPMLRLEHAEE